MDVKSMTEEEIIIQYEGLAKKLANKMYKLKKDKLDTRVMDFEDLKQLAYIGIFDAIKSYDETKGIKFMTYAWTCVQNRINREAFREKAIKTYMKFGTFSMDAVINEDGDTTVSELTGEFDINIENTEFKDIQRKLFNRLSQEDRDMLIKYNIQGITLRELAKEQGISFQRVGQKIEYITNQLKVAYMRECRKYA